MTTFFHGILTIFWYISFFLATVFCATFVIVLALFRFKPSRVFYFARLWGKAGIHFSLSRVRVEGKENIAPNPLVIISNHQSFFDVYTALGFLPIEFKIMSKKEIFDIPLLGRAMKSVEFISIDRSSPRNSAKSLIEAIKVMNKGNNVLIYPEGTRSPDPLHPSKYKAGAFLMAKSGKFTLQPVVVHGTHKIQKPHKYFPIHPSRITIKILPPVYPDSEMHPSNLASPLDESQKLDALQKMILGEFIRMENSEKG